MGSRKLLKREISGIFFIIVSVVFLLTVSPSLLSAKVSGSCSNCHTMHNSQDGTDVDSNGPNSNLLINTSGLSTDVCVGCHSAASGATWKDGVTGAPIVWNQSMPSFNTQKGLAGGNFYWVALGDDTKGHNVYGIANPDSNLSTAPGRNMDGCTNSCHDTLADPPGSGNSDRGGCRGCHVFTAHHDDSRPWYRFLKGHGKPQFASGSENYGDYVTGAEDDDWEQETAIDHNWYKGYAGPLVWSATLADTKSISSFCGGCHMGFHRKSDQFFTGIGDTSPWIRHPTDIALPQGDSTEYSAYDLTDIPTYTNYSAEAPVAWTDPTNSSNRGTPIVMCLSCHRPHGSDQPDMLRWDYSTMVAGVTNNSGCFTCHTTKDDGL